MNIYAQEQRFYYNQKDYITYVKRGTGSTSIIFLHGYGASKNSWDDFYPLFDTLKYSLYLIDLKGFGNSSIPKDNKYSINDNEEIISLFINSNISNDYYLIGHSLGGGVSLILTKSGHLNQYPKALILLDCAAYNANTPFFINYLKTPCINQLIYFFTTSKMRAYFSLKKIVNRDNFSQKILNRYIESGKGKHKKYSFIKTAKQIVPKNYEEFIAFYDKIAIPTLIIWGNQDRILSIEQGKLLSKQIIHSKLETIENCGHIPHEEKPIETFEIVNEFLINQQK